MNFAEIDRQLKRVQNQLDEFSTQLLAVRDEFCTNTTAFLRNWYWIEASDVAMSKPLVTKQLGAEVLAEMKQEVKALQEQAGALVKVYVDRDDAWWDGNEREFGFGNNPPIKLESAIRQALSQLGPILNKYRYLEDRSEKSRRHAQTAIRGSRVGSPCCLEFSNLPQDLAGILGQYKRLVSKSAAVKQELTNLTEQKNRCEESIVRKPASIGS